MRQGIARTLTWEVDAERLDGRGHFLLADLFVLLSLGGSLQALPGQTAQVEVHQHIAQGF